MFNLGLLPALGLNGPFQHTISSKYYPRIYFDLDIILFFRYFMDHLKIKCISARSSFWITPYVIVKFLMTYPIESILLRTSTCFWHERNRRKGNCISAFLLWVKRGILKSFSFLRRIKLRTRRYILGRAVISSSSLF